MCIRLFYTKLKFLKEFEVEIMIVPKSFEDFSKKKKGQEFTSLKDKYVFNKNTKEIEKLPVQEDLQEIIDSYSNTALDKIYEKFNGDVPVSADRQAVYGYAEMKSDLADIGDMYEKADYYKEKFGLDPALSVGEVYEYVGKEAEKLKEELSKKGVIKNVAQKEDKSQSVETPVQKDGETDAQA